MEILCSGPWQNVVKKHMLNWLPVNLNYQIGVISNSHKFVIIKFLKAFYFKIPRIPLAVHLRFTSGSLPVHLDPIDGHMRCPIIQFYKKN